MISPETIDLHSLPSLPLKKRSKLPHISGIYFVIDAPGTIQYIGRSADLKYRWLSHHRYLELKAMKGIRVAWMEINDSRLLPEIELILIRYFCPPLNNRGLLKVVPEQKIVEARPRAVKSKINSLPPQTTIQELKAWIDNHNNDGLVNGKPVVTEERKELRHGTVPEELIDRALLMSAPLGYTKSEIAIVGATRLLSNAVMDGAIAGMIAPTDFSDGTEFRAYLPQGLYNLVQRRKAELGWSNSQLMVMILTYFSHDPGIEKIYRQWAKELSESFGLSEAEIEQAVYDRRRYQARVKRYELSVQKGELVSDRKIAT